MENKRKNYTNETIKIALDAIKNGMSFRKASVNFKIPKTTLIDKIHHKYREDSTSGASTVLNKTEEEHIVQWIYYLENVGFPVTKSQLLESVAKLVKQLDRETPFKNGIPGRHWYENFLKRHPQLANRVSQNLTQPRANITEKSIRDWFSRVQNYISEHNYDEVLQDPKRIFNCDESAFYLSPKEKQVIVRKGSKKVYSRVQNDEKECLTILITISADGNKQPPLVLFPYKRLPANVILKMPSNWSIGRSETGWMTGENFYEYVTNVFHPWLVKNRITMPVILFLDGHSSHINLPLTEFCKENGIILTALLPNSTHRLQPLDVAVFRPLKHAWKNKVQKWRIDNIGQKLKREDFSQLMDICLTEMVIENTIKNGFRSCGLYPFNADNFNYSKLLTKLKIADTKPVVNNVPKISDDSPTNKLLESTLLLEVEKRINRNLLQQFKSSGNEWQGEECDKSLFYFWKKICDEENYENNTEHEATLNANLPSLNVTGNTTELFLNLNVIDDSIWMENNDILDLEVQPDGTVEIPHIENKINSSIHKPLSEISVAPDPQTLLKPSVGHQKDLVDLDVQVNGTIDISGVENKSNSAVDISSAIDTQTSTKITTVQQADSNVPPDGTTEIIKVKKPNSTINKPFADISPVCHFHSTPTKAIVQQIDFVSIPNKENEIPVLPSPLKNVPTPFKKALFWPQENKKEKTRTVTKKITPTVATSEQFIEYQKKIEKEKKKKENEKLERARKRKAKNDITTSRDTNMKRRQKSKNELLDDNNNKNYKEGEYVIVEYEGEYFPGKIINTALDGAVVKTMAMSGNHWKWPEKDDILTYDTKDVLCRIDPPILINKRGIYSVLEIDKVRQST